MCWMKGGEVKEWWNVEVKEAMSRKIGAHKAMCQNSTEKNKKRYKSMKSKANKAVSKAMRETSEEVITEENLFAQMGYLG